MGIKKGSSYFNNIYTKKILLEELRDKFVIIDLYYILHKLIRQNISLPLFYILEFINLIEKFKHFGIKPIFVIDGRPLFQKTKKLQRTRQKCGNKLYLLLETDNIIIDNKKAESLLKKTIAITKEDIDNCKDLFNKLDCLYIHVNNCEGDTVIAEVASLLQKNINLEDKDVYVYSADFDMFLYSDITHIIKDLDFENDTFKLYIKGDILNILNITQYELILSGFITGTDYNCGLYKATMESSIELLKEYGPFNSLEDFLDTLPKININKEVNHKILIPTYNFIDRYDLVIDIFTLNNTSSITRSSIIKFINEQCLKIQEPKNTLQNFFNVKYVLDYIQSITRDSYFIHKYSEKIKSYSTLQFGFTCKFGSDSDNEYDEYDEYDAYYRYDTCNLYSYVSYL